MKRRMILKTGAGMIAILASSGVLWGSTRTPRKALAPWQDAGQSFGDIRLDCLSYAILAPSPHNRQPWRVELTGDDRMQLFCDLSRRLAHTDPYDRQITIGLGCFLELLKITAAEMGYHLQTDFFPLGEPRERERLDNRPIADIRFVRAEVTPNPLFKEILARRSNKDAFNSEQKVTPSALSELLTIESTFGSVEPERVERMKSNLYEGMEVEMSIRRTLKESADLMRFGKSEIEASPDGIDLRGPMLELLMAGGIITRENLSDPEHSQVTDYLARLKGIINSSQAIVWQTSADNSRKSQLKAGAEYMRLHLKATQKGLALQPLSQTLQEFPEMASLYKRVHDELGVPPQHRVQMLMRVGYAANPGPSPRWSVESMLTE